MSRFEKAGASYRFSPDEVDLSLDFSRPEQKAASWEVAVRRRSAGHLFTRRITLLTSPRSGNTKTLIDEIVRMGIGEAALLERLLLEACESVLASHRNGHPSQELRGRMRRPPPASWLCQGLLMKDKPNCWLGAASTGKSTLAVAVCVYYASGFRFCDRDTEQGVPMFLDWEEDFDTFQRIVFDVCRNLGVQDEWPPMVYVPMRGQRLRDRVESLGREIHDKHVGLVVMDAVAAMGAVPDEHLTYEAVALEMADCLDSLPPVTVLALDHVTGEEFKDLRRPTLRTSKAFVPNKARGSVRKVEYFRNQWTLVTDVEAEKLGRHVVNWEHTKINQGKKEVGGFATEILHYPEEISIMVRAKEVYDEVADEEPSSDAERAVRELTRVSPQSAHEVAWRVDGKPPTRQREDSIRRALDRAVKRGLLRKDGRRYWWCNPDTEDQKSGQLLPFPGVS